MKDVEAQDNRSSGPGTSLMHSDLVAVGAELLDRLSEQLGVPTSRIPDPPRRAPISVNELLRLSRIYASLVDSQLAARELASLGDSEAPLSEVQQRRVEQIREENEAVIEQVRRWTEK